MASAASIREGAIDVSMVLTVQMLYVSVFVLFMSSCGIRSDYIRACWTYQSEKSK